MKIRIVLSKEPPSWASFVSNTREDHIKWLGYRVSQLDDVLLCGSEVDPNTARASGRVRHWLNLLDAETLDFEPLPERVLAHFAGLSLLNRL